MEEDNKFIYIGDGNPDDNKFDMEKFMKLYQSGRFLDLAAYSKNYMPTNREADMYWTENIDKLIEEGSIMDEYYKNVPEEERSSTKFAYAISQPGGLYNLRYGSFIDDENGNPIPMYKSDEEFAEYNPEAYNFMKNLELLGSYKDRTATGLKIIFNDKTYGLFGINWSKGNDKNEFYDIVSKSGKTENELRAMGANISKDGDRIIVTFDKNADCAIPILTNMNRGYLFDRMKNRPTIIGFDDKGEINIDKAYIPRVTPTDTYYTMQLTPQQEALEHVLTMQDIVSNAYKKQEAYELKSHQDRKMFSSTDFDLVTDKILKVQDDYNKGLITPSEYRAQLKLAKDDVTSFLTGAGVFDRYEIYSNFVEKENAKGEKSFEVESEDWETLRQIIAGVNDDNRNYVSSTAGGVYGLKVNIQAGSKYTNEKGKEAIVSKPISVFIPGYMSELMEQESNKYTDIRALKKYNSIATYGYSHDFGDGSILRIDENGAYVIGGERDGFYDINNNEYAKQEILRMLQKQIIEEEGRKLYYLLPKNSDGNINRSAAGQIYGKFAIDAAKSLYKNVPLRYSDGTPISDYDFFFGEAYTLYKRYKDNLKEQNNIQLDNSNRYNNIGKDIDEVSIPIFKEGYDILGKLLNYTNKKQQK